MMFFDPPRSWCKKSAYLGDTDIYVYTYTPPKTNMDPKNNGFQ